MTKLWSRLIFLACLFFVVGGVSDPARADSGTLADPYTQLSQAYWVNTSGNYYFNLGSGTFRAYVDVTQGGGWILVLNYVHKAGTNPALRVIGAGANLPTIGSSTLGTDESALTANWGHAGNAAMAQFTGDIETRWYGQTSAHSRIIHFYTTIGDDYFRTGTGSMGQGVTGGLPANFTALTSHTGFLPSQTANYYPNQGNLALTNYTFYRQGNYHWGIQGNGNRWEVDNAVPTYAPDAYANDTIHRVWVRAATSPTTIPDVTNTCRVSDGVTRTGVPSIHWDAEGASPGPGRMQTNQVTYAITSGSLVTAGPGLVASNLTSSTNLSSVSSVTIDQARAAREYIQFSFVMSNSFAGYMDSWTTWSVSFPLMAIDVATQSDFSDAVNYYEGSGDSVNGWTRLGGKGRLLLEPGETYYVRMYVAGAVSGGVNGWGFDMGSCTDFGDVPVDIDAGHMQQTGSYYLGGLLPDVEHNSQDELNGGADGTGDGADEDGVTFPTLKQGQTGNLTIQVTQPSASSGNLQGWIDWNNDGDFDDAGEQIATNVKLTSGANGTITLPVTVPISADTSTPVYARFRWSSTTGLSSSAFATNGELEDYLVTIIAVEPIIDLTTTSGVFSNGLRVPGSDVYISLTVINSGEGGIDSGSLFIVNPIPNGLEFFLGDANGPAPGTDVVLFSQNGTSALTFNPATDLAYATGTTAPTSFAECSNSFSAGYNGNISFVCIRASGTLPGNGAPSAQASFSFRARIK